MKLIYLRKFSFTLFLITVISSCSTEDDMYTEIPSENTLLIEGAFDVETTYQDNEGPHEHNFGAKILGFTEGFESGSKGSYATGNANLSSGSWTLNDALIGTLGNDRKFGSKSARIRNGGYAIMNFDMDNGVETIRIRHAKYGSDGDSTWRLIGSFDSGSSWFYAGETITTNSTTLNTVTFNVNESRKVRYGIYKTSGGSNRLNIDNIEINTDAIAPVDPTPTNPRPNPGSATRDSNLTFGNPSNAGNSSDNYFLSRADYALSYSNSRGTSNWVSWHLSKAWRGSAQRCNCFKSDRALPSSFYKPNGSSYRNSGFDRGHLCPSADRNLNAESNSNTYFMTNIAPQAPDNNQRAWASFENYLRSLTDNGNEIHIISGVIGRGGSGRNGSVTTIDSGRITVPDSFWKVALVLPNGSNDINRVTTSTRVIAINMKNDQGISTNWRNFRTSVNAIENLTGYDLFENITNSVENVIEARVDNQ